MSPCGPTPVGYAAQEVTATRLSQNPLITVDTSPSLGGNVNGPTVIRVPDWIDRPLGRYYMYFANHMGEFIRLAYADAITGRGASTSLVCSTFAIRRFSGRSRIQRKRWRTSTPTWRHRKSSSILNASAF